MKYLRTHSNQRFTMNLRVPRWQDYMFIAFGVPSVIAIFFTHGWAKWLFGAAGVIAMITGVMSLTLIGVLKMGPKGVAGWYKWRWRWTSWDNLQRADTVRSQNSRRLDQLVLHDKVNGAQMYPGLETPNRVAAQEGSVQWAADLINSVLVARSGRTEQPSNPAAT